MILNLNFQEGVKHTLFPDNAPHVDLVEPLKEREDVTVVCSITDSLKMMQLCLVANIIDNNFAIKDTLIIPYLMGARYDRIMEKKRTDSFDLKVLSNLINSLEFERVILFDPHSDVAPALINKSKVVTNEKLVKSYKREKAVLIVPDGGAVKKAHNYIKWNPNLVDVVFCTKHRDGKDNLHLDVLDPEKCKDRNCIIIDDICDGGGTFNLIASQIQPDHLTLMVTHGLFTKGFKQLNQNFHEIVTTDSYGHTWPNEKRVTQYKLSSLC